MIKIVRDAKKDHFISKYESTCKSCCQKIFKGDQIKYYEGAVRHRDCKSPRGDQSLYMNEPRKKISKSFPAKSPGVCVTCNGSWVEGDQIRFNTNDDLVHARHTKSEKEFEVCNSCFLTKPCECE